MIGILEYLCFMCVLVWTFYLARSTQQKFHFEKKILSESSSVKFKCKRLSKSVKSTPHVSNGLRNGALILLLTVLDPITEMGLAHTIGFLTTYVFRNIVQNRELSPDITPPIAEIIWVKNVRAIVVCGFLMKSLKNHILKI